MRDATKRRSGLADFFTRMVKEQPLGSGGGIVVLLLIQLRWTTWQMWLSLPMFWPLTAFLKCTSGTDCRARRSSIRWAPTSWGGTFCSLSRVIYPGHRPVGTFDSGSVCCGHQYQCRGGSPDRRHFRIPRWQVRPGCAEICRCLDGIPGTAHIVDDHVPGRARRNTDNSCPGYSRRHRRLESGEGRGCRHKGKCLFSGRRGDGRLEMASVCPPCPAQYHACHNHHIQHQHRRGDDIRGFSELPRVWTTSHRSELGRFAQPGRT